MKTVDSVGHHAIDWELIGTIMYGLLYGGQFGPPFNAVHGLFLQSVTTFVFLLVIDHPGPS